MGVWVGLSGCGARLAPDETEPPAIELHGVDFWDYRGSRLAATGHSHRVYYLRESGETDASQVAVLFPSSRRGLANRWSGEMLLDSPMVHGNPLEQRAEGWGGLRLTGAGGDQATTENGRLRGKEQMVAGNASIRIWGPGYDLHAPSFRLDLGRDRLQLAGARLTVSPAQR
jgi:hypothetical protein